MSDLTGISSQQQEQILKFHFCKTGVVVRGVEAATLLKRLDWKNTMLSRKLTAKT